MGKKNRRRVTRVEKVQGRKDQSNKFLKSSSCLHTIKSIEPYLNGDDETFRMLNCFVENLEYIWKRNNHKNKYRVCIGGNAEYRRVGFRAFAKTNNPNANLLFLGSSTIYDFEKVCTKDVEKTIRAAFSYMIFAIQQKESFSLEWKHVASDLLILSIYLFGRLKCGFIKKAVDAYGEYSYEYLKSREESDSEKENKDSGSHNESKKSDPDKENKESDPKKAHGESGSNGKARRKSDSNEAHEDSDSDDEKSEEFVKYGHMAFTLFQPMLDHGYLGMLFTAAQLAPCDCMQKEFREEYRKAKKRAQEEEKRTSKNGLLSPATWSNEFCFPCQSCGKKEEKPCEFRCCKGCRVTLYCCRDHQRDDWCRKQGEVVDEKNKTSTSQTVNDSHKEPCQYIREFLKMFDGVGDTWFPNK